MSQNRPPYVVPGVRETDLTPFQPTGPYPQVMLDLPTGASIPLSDAARGERIVVEGTVFDGAGNPVIDTMVETWQADAGGHYPHPSDPSTSQADPSFWGYRRVATDHRGGFRIDTVKPGATDHDAPHILVAIYGGGILYRYVTRIYFEAESGNAADPVLAAVPADRRHTLMAHRVDTGLYRFDIRLQGRDETVFFDV
jgi:protocatechuate 3,4-dioxygenase, alpha subunit